MSINSLNLLLNNIKKIFEDEDIKSYCLDVDKFALSKLKGNDVVNHDESSFVQAFIDGLSYSFEYSDDIQKEYKIKKYNRDKNIGGKAIDVMLEKYPKIKLGIEFKNIKIGRLRTWLNGEKPSKDWDSQVNQSEKLLNETEDKILNLSVTDHYNNGGTIKEILENTINIQAKKYKQTLESEFDGKVLVFVIIRVGLRRLLIRKV